MEKVIDAMCFVFLNNLFKEIVVMHVYIGVVLLLLFFFVLIACDENG